MRNENKCTTDALKVLQTSTRVVDSEVFLTLNALLAREDKLSLL